MSFLSLDYDSICVVVSHLNCSDALNLSLTTRELHPVAMGQALSSVALIRAHKVPMFCAYMLNDVSNRLSRLRELSIQCISFHRSRAVSDTAQASGSLLADLLEQARNLRKFTLWDVEDWLQGHARIGPAISALTGLQELNLDGGFREASKVVNALRSAPRKLILGTSSITAFMPTFRLLLDTQLERRRDWPSIQQLSLGTDCNIEISDIAHAFPSLRILHLGNYSYCRRRSQELIHTDWRYLESVSGYPLGLSGWQNIIPIHHVEILAALSGSPTARRCGSTGLYGANGYRTASHIMHRSSPVALTLHGIDSGTDSGFRAEVLKEAPRLRYLSVELREISVYQDFHAHLSAWIYTTGQIISSLDIVCLEIQFGQENPEEAGNANMAYLPGYEIYNAPEFEEKIDRALAMVCALGKHMSSLRYISLYLGDDHARIDYSKQVHSGRSRQSLYWWRYTGTEEQRTAQLLEPEVGERVGAYLRSPQYDYASELNDADLVHNITESITTAGSG